MKTVILLIILISGLGSCMSSKDCSTYKGKYENGMFADKPSKKMGMIKVKNTNRLFDHQNIQRCRKEKKSHIVKGK